MAAALDELRLRGYDVTVCSNTNSFFEHLTSGAKIDLFLIDVQLPEPDIEIGGICFSTRDGLSVGVLIARFLRTANIKIPIILMSIAHLHEDVASIVEYERRDRNCAYWNKTEMKTQYVLADSIDKLFEQGSVKKSRWLQILGDSIVAKPSLFGVGLDLHALARKLKN
ncbi:MAG: hypothetical protein GY938_08800 [Ketobacter sp.]|nr:hypothetical protein [Ketobacter sp.]